MISLTEKTQSAPCKPGSAYTTSFFSYLCNIEQTLFFLQILSLYVNSQWKLGVLDVTINFHSVYGLCTQRTITTSSVFNKKFQHFLNGFIDMTVTPEFLLNESIYISIYYTGIRLVNSDVIYQTYSLLANENVSCCRNISITAEWYQYITSGSYWKY